MRRASVCVLLSAALHAALLSFVSMPTRAPMVEPSSIRVALRAASPPPAESPIQAEQTPAQKTENISDKGDTQKQKNISEQVPAQKQKNISEKGSAQKQKNISEKGSAQKTENFSDQGPAQKTENFSDQGSAQKTDDLSSSAPASPAPAAPSGVGPRAIAELRDVSVTKRVQPDYPAPSRRRRDEGTVVIVARVDGGRVVSLSVERSSGHAALDEAALRAARGWRFSEASPFDVRMPFTFKIR